MSKRKKETEEMEYNTPCFELTPGFYLVDENRNIKTKDVARGKGEDRQIVTEPIRCRTINGAKDVVAAADNPLSILCVTQETVWPVQ